MSQLDYITLFVSLACTMWLAGCCPVMIFGLYWKKGTTAGAWSALLTGMILSLIYIFVQRNWADIVYPFLVKTDMVDFVGRTLRVLSSPFGHWIEWEMNPVECPVNSIEFTFFADIFTIALYAVVSLCTCKTPYNMDRMLHRGEYAEPGSPAPAKTDWSPRGIFKALIGITPEHTKTDKLITYGMAIYMFVICFGVLTLGVVIWNFFTPWTIELWGTYFFITALVIPCILAIITMFWFGIGGILGIKELFKTLEDRKRINDLDDGRVDGNVSVVDKAAQKEKD